MEMSKFEKSCLICKKDFMLACGPICNVKFYILWQPCHDMNLANKTSFYLLHLLDGNAPDLHFFLFFFKLSKHLLHVEMESRLLSLRDDPGTTPFQIKLQ